MRMRVRVLKYLMLAGLVCGLALPAVAQAPGTAYFSHQCVSSGGILFLYQGQPIVEVSFNQIAPPLAAAIGTQQHQLIGLHPPFAVYALKSNELQIHLIANPDGTKYIIPATACGGLNVSAPTGTSTAFAFAQSFGGSATAFAHSAPGTAQAAAGTSGAGQAYAGATTTANPTHSALPASSTRRYVVQRGDNLFRIALRHGVALEVVIALNGITDPTLIHVGDVILLP